MDILVNIMACNPKITGTGKPISSKSYDPRYGSTQSNSRKPLDFIGTPGSSGKPGIYKGIGYDENGNPIYEYSGADDGKLQDVTGRSSSQTGKEFIAQQEGTGPVRNGKYQLYNDVGNPAIGYGHNLTEEEKARNAVKVGNDWIPVNSGITDEQAKIILEQDIAIAENSVKANVKVPLTQSQYDSLVSFTYNVGTGAFQNSTLLKKLNQGDYASVPSELSRWNKADGEINQGLVRRRQAEAELWAYTG